jgi:hypothetical protein
MSPDSGVSETQIPIDPERVEVLARLLRRARQVEEEYTARDLDWSGETGSRAAEERTYRSQGSLVPWTPRVVGNAYAFARVALLAAAEQLSTIASAIEQPLPGGVGVMVMARSIVEICARAAWVMDTTAGARERVGRSYGDQLYSAYHAERLAEMLELPEGARGYSPLPDELTATVSDLGLDVQASSLDRGDPRITIDGVQRPHTARLVRSLFGNTIFSQDARAIYPHLSAFTHGTHFALMHFYRETGAFWKGEKLHVRAVDQRDVEAAVGLSLVGWISAMRNVVKLTDWGYIRIDTLAVRVENVIIAGPLPRR